MAAGTIRYSRETLETRKGFAYAYNATLPISNIPNEIANDLASTYSRIAAQSTTCFDKKAGVAALLALGFKLTGRDDSPVFMYAPSAVVDNASAVNTEAEIQAFVPSEPTFDFDSSVPAVATEEPAEEPLEESATNTETEPIPTEDAAVPPEEPEPAPEPQETASGESEETASGE